MANSRYVLVDEDFQIQVLNELKELRQIISSSRVSEQKSTSEDLMDTADVMAYLKASRRTLFKYRRNGMPFKQLQNGKIYYRRHEIDHFINNKAK